MQDCRSKGLEGTASNQWKLEGLKMRCTDQQGKDTHSRSECPEGSKTLASTTEELRSHFRDRSFQLSMQNTRIALPIPDTDQEGMGLAFQIERGRSAQQDKGSTTAMQILISEGNNILQCTTHWARTTKR